MKRDIGAHGLALIKSYESFVGYVYDDKRAPVHGKYVEWQGEPVRGTLTIGYGHTNAARHPLKISEGLRITEAQALEILHVDLGECVEQVNKAVRVPVTQGQFDALVSFTFNCGAGNTRRLVQPLNRGDYDRTRGDFGHYIRSKGEVMRGLERRRHAEQVLWDDRYGDLPAHTPRDDEMTDTPRDVDARSGGRSSARINTGAIVAGGAAAGEVVNTVNGTISDVRMAQEGIGDMLMSVASSPMFWIATLAVLGVALLWYEHRKEA